MTAPASTPASRLLLADDDLGLATMLSEILKLHGFEVDTVADGESALARIAGANPAPDLLVLDVMLPGMSGFEVLSRIRAHSDLPVIMLTARGEESERIAGLTGGADDYLAKPFNPLELIARVRAVLKRTAAARREPLARDELSAGVLHLDLKRFELHASGALIALTPAELRTVEHLMRHRDEVISRADLTRLALLRPLEPYDRSIDTIVSKLRRKLADAGVTNPSIRGVRGHGYVLDDHGHART